MGHAFSSLDELGDGPGFRKIRGPLGVEAFGVNALVFYLAGYAFMNLAAFAVVVARERETHYGDHIEGVRGLGAERPLLAWPLTISMLGLAGLPATVGFIGKLYLIEALVGGDYKVGIVAFVANARIGRHDRAVVADVVGDVEQRRDEQFVGGDALRLELFACRILRH